MIKFNQLNKINATIFEFEGKEYRSTQEPYVTEFFEHAFYEAHVVDEENNEFKAVWEIKEGHLNLDEPLKVVAIDKPIHLGEIED